MFGQFCNRHTHKKKKKSVRLTSRPSVPGRPFIPGSPYSNGAKTRESIKWAQNKYIFLVRINGLSRQQALTWDPFGPVAPTDPCSPWFPWMNAKIMWWLRYSDLQEWNIQCSICSLFSTLCPTFLKFQCNTRWRAPLLTGDPGWPVSPFSHMQVFGCGHWSRGQMLRLVFYET